jgi:membrane-bound lytic murein transglycosylase D
VVEPALAPAATIAEEPVAPVLETPEDSAADEAALSALRELEFKSLAKGSDHARGVVPVPGLSAVPASDLTQEIEDLFNGSRGGAASAAGPTYDIDVESFASRARVQYYMDFFLGEARDRFTIWLGRLNRYEGMIRSRFKQYGVPEDLVYLGIVESGYSNTAVSRARAVGMWQFIQATGRRYGLEVTDWVDERRDPFKATDAAARHLLDLNQTFGSWYLAAAAYNGGAGRVSRGIRRLPDDRAVISDETFFALSDRRYLRPETRDYVPKLIAAALIAKEPRRFGFDSIPWLEPLMFDEITVPDATGLDVVARLADTAVSALSELNPHYFRGVTPPRRTSIVRVPRGKGADVARRYAELPSSERVTFLEHVVRAGETLSGIGQRYRVSVSLLRAANGRVDPRRLRVGSRLVIPVNGAVRRAPSRQNARPATPVAVSGPAPSTAADGDSTHVVRRGDTVWLIAQRYGVRVSDIKQWNGLDDTTVIRVGERLRVAPPATTAAQSGSR